MPLYEYRCDSCQKIHEVMQKFSDAPLSQCPECSGAVTKLMSMTSFSLKGSGWYTTDYKRAPSATSTPAATSAATSPSAESSSKSDGTAGAGQSATQSTGGCGSGGCGHSTH